MFKLHFFTCTFLFFCSIVYSQDKEVQIDSLEVTFFNLNIPEEEVPPSILDTVALSRMKTGIFVQFNIQHPEEVASLDMKLGKKEGKSEFNDLNYKLVKEGDTVYLTKGNKFFPIKKNKVTIIDQSPVTSLHQSSYISIDTKDKEGKKLKSVSKKIR